MLGQHYWYKYEGSCFHLWERLHTVHVGLPRMPSIGDSGVLSTILLTNSRLYSDLRNFTTLFFFCLHDTCFENLFKLLPNNYCVRNVSIYTGANSITHQKVLLVLSFSIYKVWFESEGNPQFL